MTTTRAEATRFDSLWRWWRYFRQFFFLSLFQIAVVLSGIGICFFAFLKNKKTSPLSPPAIPSSTTLLKIDSKTKKPLDGDRRKVIATYHHHRH
jgi:hypothetical protein